MDRFETYFNRAVGLSTDGFGTKAAKKTALEFVTRAYEEAERAIRNRLLETPDNQRQEESWRQMYYYFPACHVFKAKHEAVYAQFPAELALLKRAAELRATLAAMDVVAKPKKLTPAQEKKAAQAKTCQICGRPIFAEVGVIAHHGYQRPGDGYQTASCTGARELPFEVSRDVLGGYIILLEDSLGRMVKERRQIKFEEVPLRLSYEKALPKQVRWGKTEYETIYLTMTRENAEELFQQHRTQPGRNDGLYDYGTQTGNVFEYYKDRALTQKTAEIERMKDYIEFQKGRFAAWKQTLKWDANTWVKV